jgi:hypothetical protein
MHLYQIAPEGTPRSRPSPREERRRCERSELRGKSLTALLAEGALRPSHGSELRGKSLTALLAEGALRPSKLRGKSLTALLAEGALRPSNGREEDQWLWQIENK